ncbi:MAG: glycogen synthase [Planctomycetota bacterium]|jgi:starch synthase
MRIGFVAAEMAPLVKVGGLGDVVGALSAELARRGHEVAVLIPAYSGLDESRLSDVTEDDAEVVFDAAPRRVRLRRGRLGAVEVVLVDDPLVGGRGPYDYTDARDEAYLYALLCRVGADWLAPRSDIVHLHDHHASLVVPMLADRARPATLLTIHNMAFQGIHSWDHLAAAGVPPEAHSDLDWYGRGNAIKAAILGSDAVNAVSPTYAREIRETENGCGLQAILDSRGEALSGILNGIDTDVWNPATDPHLIVRYDRDELSGKVLCRAAVRRELGLPEDGTRPLIGIVSRLTEQKGFDLLRPIMPEVGALADLIVLGTGDPRLEAAFRAEAGPHVGVHIGFDDALAHRIEAGADLFLMPSRFEPCGLNQMISMRYGTLPIVRRTGGLADTVVDADEEPETGFGFVFDAPTPAALLGAIFRALKAARDGRAPRLARRAMDRDVSWSASADRYETLMESLVARAPVRT